MLTREQVLYIYNQGPEAMIAVMEAIQKRVEQLEKRVEELENEKAKNSRNSGKPPTSDGLKKVVKSLRDCLEIPGTTWFQSVRGGTKRSTQQLEPVNWLNSTQ